MLEEVRTVVVGSIVERWLVTSRASWRTLPVPSGPPAARSEGPDPDRILLLGSGIAVGYGVETHELALAGQIAKRVSAITGRGVQLDVVAGEHLTIDTALKNLTVSRLRELDAVIVTPGNLQKFLLMPVPLWRRQVADILEHVAVNAPASLRVLFVSVPEISKVVRMPRLLGWLADRSARALNAVLETSCAVHAQAEYVPFRPTERSGRDGTGRTYSRWAALIAPDVARALDEHQKTSA